MTPEFKAALIHAINLTDGNIPDDNTFVTRFFYAGIMIAAYSLSEFHIDDDDAKDFYGLFQRFQRNVRTSQPRFDALITRNNPHHNAMAHSISQFSHMDLIVAFTLLSYGGMGRYLGIKENIRNMRSCFNEWDALTSSEHPCAQPGLMLLGNIVLRSNHEMDDTDKYHFILKLQGACNVVKNNPNPLFDIIKHYAEKWHAIYTQELEGLAKPVDFTPPPPINPHYQSSRREVSFKS